MYVNRKYALLNPFTKLTLTYKVHVLYTSRKIFLLFQLSFFKFTFCRYNFKAQNETTHEEDRASATRHVINKSGVALGTVVNDHRDRRLSVSTHIFNKPHDSPVIQTATIRQVQRRRRRLTRVHVATAIADSSDKRALKRTIKHDDWQRRREGMLVNDDGQYACCLPYRTSAVATNHQNDRIHTPSPILIKWVKETRGKETQHCGGGMGGTIIYMIAPDRNRVEQNEKANEITAGERAPVKRERLHLRDPGDNLNTAVGSNRIVRQ